MRATIEFTRYRLPMMVLSIVVVVTGLVLTVQRGGFNLSVDLAGGLSQQIQIARPALVVKLQEGAELEVVVQQTTNRIVLRSAESLQTALKFSDYPLLSQMAAAMKDIPGVMDASALLSRLPSIELLAESPRVHNGRLVLHAGAVGDEPLALDEVREALSDLGKFSIKTIGARADQQFVVRVEVASDDDSELQTVQEQVRGLLASSFGEDSLIVRSTDFVGRRFSQILSQQAVWLVVVALLLIMLYVGVRFRPEYSVGALVAVAHDVLVLIGVLGTFQIEVSAATIAALLTIVGYSLNDTIVIFDRVRENVSLMRDTDLRRVVDTSITQSLSRTVITSLTTLLAVVAIYVFATGPIQTFALVVMIGVVIGTYSSMYIASPIVLLLQRRSRPMAGARTESPGTSSTPITPPAPAATATPVKGAVDVTEARSEATQPAGPRVQPVSKRRNKKKGKALK